VGRLGTGVVAVVALALVVAGCGDDDGAASGGLDAGSDTADTSPASAATDETDETAVTGETDVDTPAPTSTPPPASVSLPAPSDLSAWCDTTPTATVLAGKAAQDPLGTGAIAAYGCEHPDTYGGLSVEGGIVVVLFTADIDVHARALAELVDRPELLEVRSTTYTLAQLAAVQDEVTATLVAMTDTPLRTAGISAGTVYVTLRGDADDVAADLHARYGDAIRIVVGATTWTPAGPAATDTICGSDPVGIAIPGLVATVELVETTVTAGADLAGDVVLRNDGAAPVRFDSGQPAVAVVLDPASGAVVARYTGAIAGTGIRVDLAPRASMRIMFLGSTAACAGTTYALAPGEYDVVVEVDAYPMPDADSAAVPESGLVLAGPSPLTVVAR
jgi:hypothetical protein